LGVVDGWAAGVESPESFGAVGCVALGRDVEGLHGDEGAGVSGAEVNAVPAGV
jgi:hypothetical protein